MEPNQQGVEPVRSDETQDGEIAGNQGVAAVVGANEIADELIQPAVAAANGAEEGAADDDEKTIVEPLERALNNQGDAVMMEITIEDTQQFADYMYQKMIEAWDDETNRLARTPADAFDDVDDNLFVPDRESPPWLRHLSRECDCYKWLYIEFPQVREDTVKRLYERSAPTTDGHNTLVVAIYAYCIQIQILKRPELDAFYKKLVSTDLGLDGWTWNWLLKLIQYPYAGRRLKKNKMGFVPALVTETKEKYEAFITELHAKFPLFFEDGVLRKQVFEAANPGRTFDCVRCQNKFAVRYGVHCRAQDIVDENADQEDEDSAHHMCRSCFRFIMTDEFELTIQGANLRCFKEGCTSHIEPDSVSKYLHRATRHYLQERIRQKLGAEV